MKHIIDTISVLVHKKPGANVVGEPSICFKCSHKCCIRQSSLVIASDYTCTTLLEVLLYKQLQISFGGIVGTY